VKLKSVPLCAANPARATSTAADSAPVTPELVGRSTATVTRAAIAAIQAIHAVTPGPRRSTPRLRPSIATSQRVPNGAHE
jgi:hypothetical protein